MQLGRYGEYYAKIEFSSYNYEVYTSEVDNHGVDFVVKNSNMGEFFEVQVKVYIREVIHIFRKTKLPWINIILFVFYIL